MPELRPDDERPQEELPKAADAKDIRPEESSKSDRYLIMGVIVLIAIFMLVIFVPKMLAPKDYSLLELHERNILGKIDDPQIAYMYGPHSFVKYNDLWYTNVLLRQAGRELSIPFHYGPRQTEDIIPRGNLNTSVFDTYPNVFVTFDPLDEGLNYIAVAVGESNSVMINAFGKGVIPACTRNETAACLERPIVDCDTDTDVPIMYFAHENETNVIYLDNCIIVAGEGFELWRATDRMLFDVMDIQ